MTDLCFRCAKNPVPHGVATCDPCQAEIYRSNPSGTSWRPPAPSSALANLIWAAKLLQANCVACAQNHHGHDFAEQGAPGWLADTQARIDEAVAELEQAA